MSPTRVPGAAPQPPLTAEVRAVLACDRLARNRERLSGWLEQDRRRRAERSAGGWLAGMLWPVLKGLGTEPVASLALGALAQGWQQRSLATMPAPPLETQALGAALTVVRRHPKSSLAVAAIAGAALLWSRRHRSPP